MTASAPPPRPYLGVETERPPPYVPDQDLQQVQVTVKESVVEVEIEGLDLLKEQIKLLTARLDNREGQAPPGEPNTERARVRGKPEQGAHRGTVKVMKKVKEVKKKKVLE